MKGPFLVENFVSIKQQISADMKDAMRAKDKKKVSVLRMILSELQYAQTAEAGSSELDDKAIVKVVGSYHKRLKNPLVIIQRAKRQMK